MQTPRASRAQRYSVKNNGNLASSIQSYHDSAAMYDTMANSFQQFADLAVTSAVNTEVANSKNEGAIAGMQGAQDKTGYEQKSNLFKWDRAYNESARQQFNANVSSQASSAMSTLAKDVDGNKNAYFTTAQKMAENAIAGIEDERQRNYVKSQYQKYYGQNLPNVHKRSVDKRIKHESDTWTAGKQVFEDDFTHNQVRHFELMQQMKSTSDKNELKELDMQLGELDANLNDLVHRRQLQAKNIIAMGIKSPEEVDIEIDTSVVAAKKTAYNYMYKDSDTSTKLAVLDRLRTDPNLNERQQAMILKSLEDAESQEQKMWKTMNTRTKAEFEIESKQAVNDIATDLLDESPEVLEEIDHAWEVGYISLEERNKYRDHAINGSPVKRDEFVPYNKITQNIESFSIEDIAQMDGLTDVTKKKFIAQRMKWEEEGEEWMTAPDYRAGKDLIRDMYGFPLNSMVDIFGKEKKAHYEEMVTVIDEYMRLKEASAMKGTRNDGVAIARELIKKQKDDRASRLHGEYKDVHVLKHDKIVEEAQRKQTTIMSIVQEQTAKYPKTGLEPQTHEAIKAEQEGNLKFDKSGKQVTTPEDEDAALREKAKRQLENEPMFYDSYNDPERKD